MKVLMKKDLKKVGKAGQIIDVSDGYGANYLIPNGYAVLYTAEAQKQYDIELEEQRILDEKKRQEARELAKRLEGITLQFDASAGRNGDMIGTVSFKKASEALEKLHGIKINKSQLIDKDVIINGFGLTKLRVDLYKGVEGEMRIHVKLKEKK